MAAVDEPFTAFGESGDKREVCSGEGGVSPLGVEDRVGGVGETEAMETVEPGVFTVAP